MTDFRDLIAIERGHACRAAHGEGFARAGAEPSYAPDLALEPRHIEVRLRFDLEAQRAEGRVTTTVRARRAGARTLRLDAIALDDLQVSGPEPLQWSHDGKGIDVTWEAPFEAGEERAVEVRYTVTSPVTGMAFSRPDEAYPGRPLVVWTDHETERARYWLPCVDYPTVRTTFDFHLTAPRDCTILANGTLEGETDHGDGTKTAHWKLDQPCPSYLCCLAAGRFTRCDDEPVDGRPIAYFASEEYSAADLKRSFGRTPAMMRWLEQRLGRPFPYPKYFQLALPAVGGAMENISLVTWDDLFVMDEPLAAEWGVFVDAVNIHEMAHSYFGDDVVCRHFEHSWLKESWATYIQTVWAEENRPAGEAEYDLFVNARTYFEEADSRYVRPLVTRTYDSSFDLFDQHLYPGGACRLHMLRHAVGDEAFWAATTDYLATYSGRVVETDDFRRKVEEHAGLNLVRFFDQWIYGKGYPKLKATWKHDAEKDEATLTVEQTQVDGKKGIGLFAFPLEVDIEDDDGWHKRVIDLEEARHALIVKTKGKPRQVRIDPRGKALFRLEFNPGDEMLKTTLREAPDVRGRIEAAEELIKTGVRANLRAVGDAMANEPFFGVRARVAAALGESGAAEAIEPLAAMLRAEQDPRGLRFVAHACGGMRDPRLRDALLEFLRRDLRPAARAAAVGALGAQRDEADLELLEEQTHFEDIHHIVTAGAYRGLGAQRSRRAHAFLDERVRYGAEAEEARPAAVAALGRCAGLLDREAKAVAVDRLIDLTRDPAERVRRGAGAALADLGDTRAVPALEGLKRSLSNQDGADVDRWIARLQKGQPGEEVSKLREQVEKLEGKVRKLDEKLQDLEARSGSS